MARVQRDQAELQKQDNAKDLEIQQVLRDRYEAEQAKIENKHNRYSPGLHHMAFHAESRKQVDQFYQFLLQNSICILDAPAEYDYTAGYYAVFFADPDGIKLEFVYEPEAQINIV